MSTAGVWVVVATLAVASLVGLVLRARDGRVRGARQTSGAAKLPAAVADALGAEVTLVQLSSPVCTPCRQAQQQLSALAASTDGLAHVELNVAEEVSVARELGVMRTPTTIAYSADGAELFRVGGVPDRAELTKSLRPHLSTVSTEVTR